MGLFGFVGFEFVCGWFGWDIRFLGLGVAFRWSEVVSCWFVIWLCGFVFV